LSVFDTFFHAASSVPKDTFTYSNKSIFLFYESIVQSSEFSRRISYLELKLGIEIPSFSGRVPKTLLSFEQISARSMVLCYVFTADYSVY
jgi:hypothetical protein